MKKNLKMSAAILTAALMAGALTACGGSSSTPTAAASAADTTAADSGSAADTADTGSTTGDVSADVQKIIDAGVLKVGVKTDVPCFSLQNTATGEYEGLEDDLAYTIAGKIFGCTPDEAKEKKLVAFQGVTAKTRGPLVENGELDMVIATFTITEERKETYNFSTPYFTDAVGLLVLKDSGINSIEDLDGKVIGVAQGSTSQKGFEAYVAEKGINVTPTFEEFDGYPALAAALSAKNIDVFSVDRAILAGYRDDSNKLLDDRYAEQEYGVCTKKENTGLAELVDGVVTDLKDSGKLAEMIKDWGIE
ncbi:MAG: transporter substrate-binding domain-containing protein [Clostridium sp.]|nr:transporter substrate-binding domain-containing protein [Clostridium sp.]